LLTVFRSVSVDQYSEQVSNHCFFFLHALVKNKYSEHTHYCKHKLLSTLLKFLQTYVFYIVLSCCLLKGKVCS
jgi:hypothetical protein